MKLHRRATITQLLLSAAPLALLPLPGHAAEKGIDELMQGLAPLWIEVEMRDGKPVIQTYCDAGVANIEISRHGDQWWLSHFLGQDSDLYTINGVTPRAGEVEAYTLALSYQGYNSDGPAAPYTVTFLDEEHHYATWVREGMEATYAVAKHAENVGWELHGLSPLEEIPILPPVDDCSLYF